MFARSSDAKYWMNKKALAEASAFLVVVIRLFGR
jgi:hypothetical protein